MLEGIKSIKVTATPPKGTESVHIIPLHNTENQSLYLKEILTQKLVKIGKDSTVKLEIGKAKEAIKSLIAKCTVKD